MKKFLRKISSRFGPRSMEQALNTLLPREVVRAAALKFQPAELLEGLAREHQLNADKLLELVAKRLRLSKASGFSQDKSELAANLSEQYSEQFVFPLISSTYFGAASSSQNEVPAVKAFAVADPFSALAQRLRQQGAELFLALPGEIREAWEQSKRGKLSAGARAMLDLLLNDVARFSAAEVSLGLPTVDSFSFQAKGRQYQGKLHPAVLKELWNSSLEFLECEIQGEVRRLDIERSRTKEVVYLSNVSSQNAEEVPVEQNSAIKARAQIVYDVLLVEDEDRFAFILEQALSTKELTLKRVRTVKEGLTLIRESKGGTGQRFKVIICDLNLPGEDGRDFIRLARELDSAVAIIMLTSEESKEIRAELLDLGANAYVKKNDDPRLLLAWVHNLSERDGCLRKYA